MLAKSQRLNLKLLSTKNIFTDGYFWKGKFLSANFDFQGEKNSFAVVIPKKIAKLAVSRNKIKRFIYNNLSQEIINNKFGNLRLIIRLKSKVTSEKENLDLINDLKKLTDFIFKNV